MSKGRAGRITGIKQITDPEATYTQKQRGRENFWVPSELGAATIICDCTAFTFRRLLTMANAVMPRCA